MRHIHFIVVILLLASLACSVISPSATPTQPPQRIPSSPTAPAPATDTPLPATQEATPSTTGEPQVSPAPTQVLPPEINMQMNAIQQQVIDLRGLQPTGDVQRALLNPDELRQRVINDFLADYTPEESADDSIELAALGLLTPGFDLNTFYINFLSEQIAGYYDHKVGEMYVVQGEGFLGPERLTYSHEYTHVLQDQNYDIDQGLNYNPDSCDVDSERCAAIQSLIEGDATLTELTWFTSFATANDQQQVIDFYNTYQSPIYDSAPPFMQQDFLFPYNQGYTFVQTLFDQGGWNAVDAAYQNPPISTEQIMHPERYPTDTPVSVELPDLLPTLGDGWRELDSNTMGEWYTYLILGYGINPVAQLEDSLAAEAAAGWGGDSYLVYYNDARAETIVILRTTWDTPNDASQFVGAFRTYAEARFGVAAQGSANNLSWTFSNGYSELSNSGSETLWILAPDLASAQIIRQAVPGQ
jgi:hypothetical protein